MAPPSRREMLSLRFHNCRRIYFGGAVFGRSPGQIDPFHGSRGERAMKT